jgi:hypothetical protein
MIDRNAEDVPNSVEVCLMAISNDVLSHLSHRMAGIADGRARLYGHPLRRWVLDPAAPLASQMRLMLHIAVYGLMRVISDAIPQPQLLTNAEIFDHPCPSAEDRGADKGECQSGVPDFHCELPQCRAVPRTVAIPDAAPT